MQIGIDLAGHLRKLRSAGYHATTFVAELIQNAQRAKASRISFWLEGDYLLVEDDGVGCSDPSEVFTLSRSGWDAETAAIENPFGEGFFSILPVASRIDVQSQGWSATWDVDRTIETGVLDVEVQTGNRPKGFEVEIRLTVGVDTDAIREAIRKEALYVPNVEVLLNEAVLPKVRPEEVEQYRVSGVNFSGSITFVEQSDTHPVLLHRGRIVRTIEALPHLRGVIEVSKGITLRAPDRKDVIPNQKWEDTLKRIRKEVTQAANACVAALSENDLARLGYALAPYVDPKVVEEALEWKCLEGSDDEASVEDDRIEYEDDLKIVREAAQTATLLAGVDPRLLAAAFRSTGAGEGQADSGQTGSTGAVSVGVVQNALNLLREASAGQAVPAASPVEGTPGRSVQRPEKGLQPGFWTQAWAVEQHKRLVGLCRYYHIPLYIVSDPVRTRIVREKCPHINQWEQVVQFEDKIDARPLTKLQPAWDEVCQPIFGRKIQLASGKIRKVLTARLGEKTIKRNVPVLAAAVRETGTIVFARAAMWPANTRGALSAVTLRKFVLHNLNSLAHELAHLIFDTADGTLEHYQMESRLSAALARAVVSRKDAR